MIDSNKSLLFGLLGFIFLSSANVSAQPDDEKSVPSPPAAKADNLVAPVEGEAISFARKCVPGTILYYIIESEFRESGGVPPLLSYSTTIKDRRTIHEKVLPQTLRQPTSAGVKDDLVTILWKVDRYEVIEQGMKDTVSYDSVRLLYPPSAIWELGGIAGSKTTFYLDPRTGRSEGYNITLNKTGGEGTRRPLSKIATKCQLNNQNLEAMVKDLGAYWMPEKPVREGETWTKHYNETVRTFGEVKTALACTLKSIRRSGDRRIATVEIQGDVVLIPATPPATTTRPVQPNRSVPNTRPGVTTQNNAESKPGTTTQPTPPAQPAPRAVAAQQQREFSIDKSACKGTVEFDIDAGELVSMNLHRETEFVAKIDSEKSGPMELRSGTSHVFKVKTGKTVPPKPIIVGGPKPPEDEPEVKPATPKRPTSRPATSRPFPTMRPTTPTTRPAIPRSR